MIQKNLMLYLFLIGTASSTYAMKESEDSESSDSSDFVILPQRLRFEELKDDDNKETLFNNFYSSFKKTENEDDIHNDHMRMQKSVFIQLCVQAEKENTLDKQPYQELLQRFKEGVVKIEFDNIRKIDYVMMTVKDAKYRLLPYIPKGKTLCLVNDKKVSFGFYSFQTKENFILWSKEMKEMKTEEEASDGLSQSIFHAGQLSGKGLETYGHDFEDDKEHHEKICKEFEQLLKK